MNVDDDVRNFLGLGPEDPLVPVATDEAPAVPPRAFQASSVAEIFGLGPHCLPILDDPPSSVRAWRLVRAPEVVLVEPRDLSGRHGAVEDVDRYVALDGRSSVAAVRWVDARGEHALVNDHGHVSLFEIGSAALARLRAQAPDVPLLGSRPPEADELLGPRAEAWLRARVEALHGARAPILAAASVGLAGRLGPDPVVARSWAERLGPEDRALVDADLRRQVGAATERLARLSDSVRDGADASGVLGELVDLRDVMASAEWVLRPSSVAVEEALRALDREVEDRWSELPAVPSELADLCEEVAWREPWAWWGRLAEAWS